MPQRFSLRHDVMRQEMIFHSLRHSRDTPGWFLLLRNSPSGGNPLFARFSGYPIKSGMTICDFRRTVVIFLHLTFIKVLKIAYLYEDNCKKLEFVERANYRAKILLQYMCINFCGFHIGVSKQLLYYTDIRTRFQ